MLAKVFGPRHSNDNDNINDCNSDDGDNGDDNDFIYKHTLCSEACEVLSTALLSQCTPITLKIGLPRWHGGEEPTCQCRRPGFDPWVRKIPWRRKWQPSPVFLPGESHGQRSLEGYSPWGRKSFRHD